MNDEHLWPGNDDTRLDRLVDGELSAGEYRTLLASLDEHPDGWRHCAMSFLEAQAWGQDVRAIGQEAQTRSGEAIERAGRPWLSLRIVPLVLTAAASFLAAFGLSAMVGFPGSSQPTVPQVAGPTQAETSAMLAADDLQTVGPKNESLPPSRPGHPQPWGDLRMVVDGEHGPQDEIRVPVFAMEDEIARRMFRNASPIPAEVQQALQSMGYEVRRNRRWTGVPVEGRRRVYVPVDQVEIMPVSRRAFQ